MKMKIRKFSGTNRRVRVFMTLLLGAILLGQFSLNEKVFPANSIKKFNLAKSLKMTVPKKRIRAPDFELLNLDGKPGRGPGHYKGRVILIHFWATWCHACKGEITRMEELKERVDHPDFEILSINVDRGGKDTVRSYKEKYRLNLPILLDPEGLVRNLYEVNALPVSYLIARDGKFSGRFLGARKWNRPGFLRLIRSLLLTENRPD